MFRNIRFAQGLTTGFFTAAILTFAGQAMAETATLASAPNVPQPLARSNPATVVVKLSAKEFTGTLADDVKYAFWGINAPVANCRV